MSQPPSNGTALQVRGVSFAYVRNTPVLEGLDLHVPRGAVHCLLGQSGCGKSTLLRLISGLERVQAGEIIIAGRTVASPKTHVLPERRRIGMVFQDYALFPNLSVRRNVLFGIRRMPRSERPAIANEMIERVGMTEFADRMPHTLSGGQQQRVALARALASRPEVMLLDEPFSSLDADTRSSVRTEMLGILRSADVATLMVTHDPNEAHDVGDEVTWLGGEEARREPRR